MLGKGLKNNYKTTGSLFLLLAILPLNACFAQLQNSTANNSSDFFQNNWLIILFCISSLAFLIFFFKKFTVLKFENFESYTTYTEVITKIRVLSILALILFPLTEYYSAEYLKLYPSNWSIMVLIGAVSVISLLLSYVKNLPFSVVYYIPQISYAIDYALVVNKGLEGGMLPALAIETACLILFSKLIFDKLRFMLGFLGFAIIINLILFLFFEIPEANFDIYVSATAQAAIVSVALFLVEGSTNRKLGFGSKILESSNLFILVANKSAEFIFVNEHLESITGLSQNEILKDGWWRFLGHDEATTRELKKLITDSIAKNQNSNYESTIKGKQGEEIHISWENTIIEEKYLLAVGKNVSVAKQLQLEEERRKEKTAVYSATITRLITFPYAENSGLDTVLENITKNAAMAMDIARVAIWEFKSNQLVCKKIYNKYDGSFSSGETLSNKDFPIYFSAISSARIVNAPDVNNHPETAEFIREYFILNQIQSLLDTPLFVNGHLAGVICCEEVGRRRVWDGEDINFVRSIANFVALSIEAAKRKELEREYKYILNNAGDIIYTTDALGNFEFINRTATKLLGYNPELIKGKHFTTIIHPDYVDMTAVFYLRQFKKKIESTYLEFKVLNANGEEYWVGQSVKLITERDNPDKIKGFQAVVRDINKQKQAESALLASESNFRQLNENINETFYLYNFQKNTYDYISPNCKTIMGAEQAFFYSNSDYVGAFVLDEDKQLVKEANSNGLGNDPVEVEFRIIVDGKIKWIRERTFPIQNEKGVVVKRSGVMTDITEKKNQDERLKQLSLVTQTVSNGVVITSSEGLVEWCNDSMLKMMEFDFEELVGKRPIEVFSGSGTSNKSKHEIIQTKLEDASIEILQYTKSGKAKWLLISNTPLLDAQGKIEKYIEVVTDITDKKELESEYSYILNNAGDIIYTTNENGIIEFLNESISNILGYAPSDLIGKHFTHIIHPEDKKRVAMFYFKQFAQKKSNTYYEFRVLDKNGKENWVGQNVKLVNDAANPKKIKGFQSILRDITKQKSAEIALIESENNFRQINEAIKDVFYLYNFKTNKYDYISPNCLSILGADQKYFYEVNSYMQDFVLDKDRDQALEELKKVWVGESIEVEYRVRIDNEIRWIKEKAFAIRNANSEVIKSSGTCEDITQKKMEEKRILKINKELSTFSEDLAVHNLLKEQLIYTNNFEEIARVSLNTLKVKIPGIARGSLFLLKDTSNAFEVYFVDNYEINKSIYSANELKSYPILKQGKKHIEYNVNLSKNPSKSDIDRAKEGIVSYIMLPINYSKELIGALALEFEHPFNLGKRELDILENFTSVLPVVVHKLNLQKELSSKTRDILSSLDYAKSIQRSILPNVDLYKDSLKAFMSLYMPKDVVSGDFYIVEAYDEYLLIALGDCTGHGVPGAFLTLLGSNFLQRIAIENKVNSPAQILEQLDHQLFTHLNKNAERTVRDGMELGICLYNKQKKTLTFAGAGLFLVYYKNNEQLIVQGEKRSIGDENYLDSPFTETELQLNGTEKFYMFSDGYRDQLGGIDRRKRFSRAKFFEQLDKIKNLPAFQQEYLLKAEHQKHKGKLSQTDDISVIGFELK